MQVTQTQHEGLVYGFSVSLPPAKLNEKVEAKLAALQPKVKVNGFRPGKVPMSQVRAMYEQSVRGEAVEDAVNDAMQAVLTERNLRAATQPKVKLESSMFDMGKDLTFSMTVEVLPTFTPTDASTLKLQRPVVTVSDADIDERLTDLAKRLTRTAPAPAGHAAQNGDTTVISFKGTFNGVARADMAADKFAYELGSGDLVPGFDEKLIGAKAGDELAVVARFPENYHAGDLAGKTADFAVTVLEVKVPVPATIDDEFAKMLGAKDVADLRAKIQSSLEGEFASAARGKLKRQVMDALDAAHQFDLPPTMLDNEFKGIWQQLQQAKQRGQLDPEDAAKDDAALEAEYKKIAARRVRLGLVLAEMGTQHKVRVTNAEIQNAVRAEAMRFAGQEQQVAEFYMKNQQALGALQAAVFEDKVIDKIIELAAVTDTPTTKADLFKMED